MGRTVGHCCIRRIIGAGVNILNIQIAANVKNVYTGTI